jgi:hypothetical protein
MDRYLVLLLVLNFIIINNKIDFDIDLLVYNNNLYLGFIPKNDSNYKFFEKIVDTNDFASELTVT